MLAWLVLLNAAATISVLGFDMEVIGRYETGKYLLSAAETGAYDARTQRMFITNAADKAIDVLDISNPSDPTRMMQINLPRGGPSSVSVSPKFNIFAVAVGVDNPQEPGFVYFYDTDGNSVGNLQVGAMPDMLTYSPDGNYLLVANEGEADPLDSSNDPEGSVSVIDVRSPNFSGYSIRTADFNAFDSRVEELRRSLVRIFPGKSASEDLEPEYITVSPDSTTAYVVLQEANAIAIVDILTAQVQDIRSLGLKDHSIYAIDVDDRYPGIDIATWPVYGMYQPDGITSFEIGGELYLATANEGDDRGEGQRVANMAQACLLEPDTFGIADLSAFGRLVASPIDGLDNNGMINQLCAFGARSFSIWDAEINQVYDSGDDFEQTTSSALPDDFNSKNDVNGSYKSRSDRKGPEPEAITVGKIYDTLYAFIGLEQIGGIMAYDISNPQAPEYLMYVNNRDFNGDPATGTAGDLGIESMVFVSKEDSPNDSPLLIAMNEVSGTTTVYQIDAPCNASCQVKQFGLWLISFVQWR